MPTAKAIDSKLDSKIQTYFKESINSSAFLYKLHNLKKDPTVIFDILESALASDEVDSYLQEHPDLNEGSPPQAGKALKLFKNCSNLNRITPASGESTAISKVLIV